MSYKLTRLICIFLVAIALTAEAALAEPDVNRFDPLVKTDWYGLYMQGAKIGYVKASLEKIGSPVTGWSMQMEIAMVMKMGDQQVTMNIVDQREYQAPGGQLYASYMRILSPNGALNVTGKKDGDKFIVSSDIGGQVTDKSFTYPVDYLDSTLYIESLILSGKAAVGDSLAFSSFEPTPPLTGLVRQRGKIEAKESYIFNGVATDVYSISIFRPDLNLTIISKYDMHANTLEGSLGGGMTVRLEGEKQAQQLEDTYDIIANNIIKPDRKIENPQKLRKVKLEISGIDTTDVIKSSMQGVKYNSGNLILDISRPRSPKKTPKLGQVPDDVRQFLASDPYEQSDNPQIIDLAKTIVGDESNSWGAAKKINSWVYKNIEKRFTPDFSNALQTLNSKQGDCGEHTALAVALMRASGIPARPVVGLIYYPPGGGFGYHAWTEVYVGEWVQMDPTWNEELANPTHVSLAEGDIIAQVSVLHRVIGKMAIKVLGTK